MNKDIERLARDYENNRKELEEMKEVIGMLNRKINRLIYNKENSKCKIIPIR